MCSSSLEFISIHPQPRFDSCILIPSWNEFRKEKKIMKAHPEDFQPKHRHPPPLKSDPRRRNRSTLTFSPSTSNSLIPSEGFSWFLAPDDALASSLLIEWHVAAGGCQKISQLVLSQAGRDAPGRRLGILVWVLLPSVVSTRRRAQP